MKKLFVFIIVMLMAFTAYAENIDFVSMDVLITAIIKVESDGNPNAVSSKGGIGLMQITPIVLEELYNATGVKLSPISMFDPKLNVAVGEWYLNRLINHYKCERAFQLLAAYNGGITRLRKVGYDYTKMPKETVKYVEKVMRIIQDIENQQE